jgi:hypothetical protein
MAQRSSSNQPTQRDYLVAGAEFEPTTSRLCASAETIKSSMNAMRAAQSCAFHLPNNQTGMLERKLHGFGMLGNARRA